MNGNEQAAVLKVLLLEDEALARWIARKSLEEAGALVLEAETCAQARQHIEASSFDLLVLDYRLPDGVGLDVLRYARKLGRKETAIMLSAETERLPAPLIEELDIYTLLSKPIDLEKLHDLVEKIQQQAGRSMEADEENISTEKDHWISRFRVISLSSHFSAEVCEAIHCSDRDHGWLAIDFSGVNSMDESVPKQLSRLAETCRQAGGRLALMKVLSSIAKTFQTEGVLSDFDLVQEERALDALGRRLSSYCERSSLLGSAAFILATESEDV